MRRPESCQHQPPQAHTIIIGRDRDEMRIPYHLASYLVGKTFVLDHHIANRLHKLRDWDACRHRHTNCQLTNTIPRSPHVILNLYGAAMYMKDRLLSGYDSTSESCGW